MITEVKSDGVAIAAQGSAAVVVDLGLAIGEAAKIIGVLMAVAEETIVIPGSFVRVEAAYSFDPEDVLPAVNDDEQFAHIVVATSSPAAATGCQKQSEEVYLDFSGLSLVTTRNLSLSLLASGSGGAVIGKVYYERYKPSANDLNMLIATRR